MKRILLVEDDGDIRVWVRKALEWQGFSVCEAQTAEQARTFVDTHFDLLITDILLPGMNGYDFAAWFDRHNGGLSGIIFISGFDSVRSSDRYLGPTEYLAKPFVVDDLMRIIAGLDERSRARGVAI